LKDGNKKGDDSARKRKVRGEMKGNHNQKHTGLRVKENCEKRRPLNPGKRGQRPPGQRGKIEGRRGGGLLGGIAAKLFHLLKKQWEKRKGLELKATGGRTGGIQGKPNNQRNERQSPSNAQDREGGRKGEP